MKHALMITAALALSACATTADLSRISDQTYHGGKGVAVSPIPPQRPVRAVDPCRIWNTRPSIFDECSGSDVRMPETPAEPAPAPHPETPKPVEPPKQPEPPKGNASANNGTGGNYDKTGHVDNGKGRK
jgi:hypothetical protein